jgi:hypothetical protein
MIFPYSFRKAYLGKNVGGSLQVLTSGAPYTVTEGVFGFCTVPNGIEGNFTNTPSATMAPVKMVTGSWYPKDKIAPFYGGLQAPYYTKSIDPRRVTKFIKSPAAEAQQQVAIFGWDKSSASNVGPVFYCGEPYFLRLDMLGSPALRLLNHQIYVTLPAYGGCCGTDCSSSCTSTAVDPACVMLQWNDYMRYGTYNPGIGNPSMNSNAGVIPYLTQFFMPAVYVKNGASADQVYSELDVQAAEAGTYSTDPAVNAAVVAQGAYVCEPTNPASVIAGFQLTGSYYETQYNTCTFTPSDYFEIEPIFCKASLMTGNFSNDSNWGQCAVNTTINTSVPNLYKELQAPVYPKGLGQQVIRELILSERYKQNPLADSIYVDSYRMRDIEGTNWMINEVNPQGYYDSIAIVYNIFRPQNSQSVHNNDEYVEIIYVPKDTSTTTFTNLFESFLAAVGSPVTLETI